MVGFDNWDVMAEAARPPLTSVDMNLDALGRAAGECLLEMMAGRPSPGVRRLPCSLVVREFVRRADRRLDGDQTSMTDAAIPPFRSPT